MAVCSEIRTKHVNTLCGQNVELLHVNPGGIYSDHCTLKGEYTFVKIQSVPPSKHNTSRL